jgi:C4-dicarboxylate transporter DctQ subunit
MITRLNKIVDLFENALVTGLILTATLVAIAQVVARYVFNNSLFWSEEVILYSFITMSFLTMGMGVRYASHISVEVVYAFVPPGAVRVLRIGSTCLGLIFAGVVLWYGSKLVMNTARLGQLSPALRIPVGYIYAVIPTAAVLMIMRYLLVLQELTFGRGYTPPEVDVKTS